MTKKATNPSGVIHLAASTPIATHAQLAALEFEPYPQLVGFDKDPEAMDMHEQRLRTIGIMSRFAMAHLGKTKAELIEAVRASEERHEGIPNEFLEYLTRAREMLEALLSFIGAAEIRHACACANVFADDGEKLPPIPKPPEPTLGRRRGPAHLRPV